MRLILTCFKEKASHCQKIKDERHKKGRKEGTEEGREGREKEGREEGRREKGTKAITVLSFFILFSFL